MTTRSPFRTTWLIAVLALSAASLILAACGSGGSTQSDQNDPDTTSARASRAPRQEMQAQPTDNTRPDANANPGSDAVVAATDGRIIEGGYADGVLAVRNVLGDPDAPVLITEYSDFR